MSFLGIRTSSKSSLLKVRAGLLRLRALVRGCCLHCCCNLWALAHVGESVTSKSHELALVVNPIVAAQERKERKGKQEEGKRINHLFQLLKREPPPEATSVRFEPHNGCLPMFAFQSSKILPSSPLSFRDYLLAQQLSFHIESFLRSRSLPTKTSTFATTTR